VWDLGDCLVERAERVYVVQDEGYREKSEWLEESSVFR